MLRSSMRERKRVGVQVDRYDQIIGDVLYAFQEPVVRDAVRAITGHASYSADPPLYAAGISVMTDGDYLSLLYYVTPDWDPSWGGNLELWDPKVPAATVAECRFNRLLLMETTSTSWHSVSKVHAGRARYCVSNYYFSEAPPVGNDYRHVTTFNGWPDEHPKRALLTMTDKVVFNGDCRLRVALLGVVVCVVGRVGDVRRGSDTAEVLGPGLHVHSREGEAVLSSADE